MSTITHTQEPDGQASLRENVVPVLAEGKKGKAARRAIRDMATISDSKKWNAWAKYLATRKKPVPLPELLICRHETAPLLWAGKYIESLSNDNQRLIQKLNKVKPTEAINIKSSWTDRLRTWLTDSVLGEPTVAYALECLAWTNALPNLATRIPATLWWELLEHLLEVCRDSTAADPHHKVLACQLFSGELPLTLSQLFPELNACHTLGHAARQLLSDGLVDLLDGEGMPHSGHLPLTRPLLACWTRSVVLSSQSKKSALRKDAFDQYVFLVAQALRMCRADGSQVFSADHGRRHALEHDLVSTAVAHANDEEVKALARLFAPTSKSPTISASHRDLPDSPSNNAEWAQLAILRANWTPASPCLTVTYADKQFCSELNSAERTIWSGASQPRIAVDGNELKATSHWDIACWVSDDDADYLELEMHLSRAWRIQRQLIAAREDYFLYFADVLLGENVGEIEYQCTHPLGPGIRFHGCEETRDGVLMDKKRLGTVLPLALAEWRSDPRRPGELSQTSDGLRLTQSARGRALYAPLFLDLHPRRRHKSVTWRQLTVAEKLQTVSRDTAVGYRAQVGRMQWLFYRSLVANANRTVLGENLSTEFLAARFVGDGEVSRLVEVE